VSKLFQDMQEAAKFRTEQPATSQAGTQLLQSVRDETGTACDPVATVLKGCRQLTIPSLHRPFLMAEDETPSTHGAFEGYRALRTKLVRLQSTQGVRSVVVSSAESGEGKTVSVLNMALSLAQLPSQRVLIVDADLRSSGLSAVTGATEGPGLAEVLAGEASFDKAPLSTNIRNLYLVGAGEASAPAGDLFSGQRFKEFIGWCNESFTMVIVDCPPMLGLADFDVVSSACDGVLLVVRAQRTKRERLTDLIPQLRGQKLLGVLLNGQEKRKSRSRYGYYYSKIHKGSHG
jgi:capsular exopolysaccharide synthesis family protein